MVCLENQISNATEEVDITMGLWSRALWEPAASAYATLAPQTKIPIGMKPKYLQLLFTQEVST